jgi:Protein of unknown function (DUF3710)
MEPVTVNGLLFRALARDDKPAIRSWQAELTGDEYARDTIDLMARYAVAALAASLGESAFDPARAVRLHSRLVARGFQAEKREVDSALKESGNGADSDAGVADDELLGIRIGLVPLLAQDAALSDEALDELLVAAEAKIAADRQEIYPPRWDRPDPLSPADTETQRFIDLGPVLVPEVEGLKLGLDAEGPEVIAANLLLGPVVLQVQAFSAPDGPLWEEIRADNLHGMLERGDAAEEADGPFGREIVGTYRVKRPDGAIETRRMRLIAREGPDWLLRGAVFEDGDVPGAVDAALDAFESIRVNPTRPTLLSGVLMTMKPPPPDQRHWLAGWHLGAGRT